MPPLSSTALRKIVRPPSAVANSLDWKKAISGAATAMAIDVHADHISLALATLRSESESESESDDICIEVPHGSRRSRPMHQKTGVSMGGRCNYNYYPSQFLCDMNCVVLDSIPLTAPEMADKTDPAAVVFVGGKQRRRRRKRAVPLDSRREMASLVRDHKVCGFIVSWPIQQDTGLNGASCGRTLWTIEQLLEGENDGDSLIFAPFRPLCLWNGVNHHSRGEKLPVADAFGRSSIYARTSTKTEHYASKEQYHRDESVSAVEVWTDFFEHHWPAAKSTKVRDRNEKSGRLESRYNQSDPIYSPRRTLAAA